MEKQLPLRVGQGVMTCATTACFNGLDSAETVSVGGNLRFFGDGFQTSKLLGGRRFWRIPVMEGEFLVEDRFGIQRGVAGGNLLILGQTHAATLAATDAAVTAIRRVRDVALPFPGGIARSGSKVGSRYKPLRASTNDAYCPTLRPMVQSSLPDGVNSVLEIVVIGLSEAAIRCAMRVGAEAACCPGIVRISAGNYGGRLGKVQIRLQELWP
jgi:formylmethanofuran--tetrahydromethanopterin N-formyltransferase